MLRIHLRLIRVPFIFNRSSRLYCSVMLEMGKSNGSFFVERTTKSFSDFKRKISYSKPVGIWGMGSSPIRRATKTFFVRNCRLLFRVLQGLKRFWHFKGSVVRQTCWIPARSKVPSWVPLSAAKVRAKFSPIMLNCALNGPFPGLLFAWNWPITPSRARLAIQILSSLTSHVPVPVLDGSYTSMFHGSVTRTVLTAWNGGGVSKEPFS